MIKKWCVAYTRRPTSHNKTFIALVEAESAIDAKRLVEIELGDFLGTYYTYGLPIDYSAIPKPRGKVVTMFMGME